LLSTYAKEQTRLWLEISPLLSFASPSFVVKFALELDHIQNILQHSIPDLVGAEENPALGTKTPHFGAAEVTNHMTILALVNLLFRDFKTNWTVLMGFHVSNRNRTNLAPENNSLDVIETLNADEFKLTVCIL